jgi:hypothetical protein
MSETRLYWLSFADPDKPKGEQFLGVSIVRVTKAEAINEALDLAMNGRPAPHNQEAFWLAAAARKAWRLKINPGGEMAALRLDDQVNWPYLIDCPVDVQLTPEQIQQFGWRKDVH